MKNDTSVAQLISLETTISQVNFQLDMLISSAVGDPDRVSNAVSMIMNSIQMLVALTEERKGQIEAALLHKKYNEYASRIAKESIDGEASIGMFKRFIEFHRANVLTNVKANDEKYWCAMPPIHEWSRY